MQVKIEKSVLIVFLINLLLILSVTNAVYAADSNEKPNAPVLKQSITVIKNEGRILSSRYLIQAGDVFSFSVYDEPSLTQQEITVRPDGYATIDPIGEIYVAGYDIQNLTNIIAEKLSSFIRTPQISINIREFHPAVIYVYGAVQKPGMYQQITQSAGRGAADPKNPITKTDLNISNVIANAGGITEEADLENVEITGETGEKRTVNLWKLLSEGDVSQNILLRSGDRVFIPKLNAIVQRDEDFKTLSNSSIFPETFPVRVIGEVARGGLFELPSKTPYLNSAIALASGYNIDANKKNVLVLRKTPKGNMAKIYVDPNKNDLVLRPNDTIMVNTKSYVGPVRIADYITRFISPTFGFPNAINSWADVFNPARRWQQQY
jgi:polysaccharide export outer membrane protein